MIRVLLVDDQPLLRGGFRALLEVEDTSRSSGRRPTARKASPWPRNTCRTWRSSTSGCRWSTASRRRDALGAAGFLVKDMEPEDLLHAVRVTARGDALLAPAITRKLIDRYVSQPLHPSGLEGLTERERETVALVAQGLSNDQIAEHLVISPLTARTHVSRAMAKLHARNRAQLVIHAYESGLVVPRGG